MHVSKRPYLRCAVQRRYVHESTPFRTQKPISIPWGFGSVELCKFPQFIIFRSYFRKKSAFWCFSALSITISPQVLWYECRGFRTFFPTKRYPFVMLVCYERCTIIPFSYPFCRGFRTSFVLIWLCRSLVQWSPTSPCVACRRFDPTNEEDDDMGDNEDNKMDNALSWGAEDSLAYGLCAKYDA